MQIAVERSPAKARLRQQLDTFFTDTIFTFPMPVEKQLVRVQISVRRTDLLDWLNQQSDGIKTYWCDRRKSLEVAGVGAADLIQLASASSYESLLKRVSRYLNTLMRWLDRIDSFALASQRRITIPLVRRVLEEQAADLR